MRMRVVKTRMILADKFSQQEFILVFDNVDQEWIDADLDHMLQEFGAACGASAVLISGETISIPQVDGDGA